jgi:RNA polymerase primary sigma factor
MKTTPNSQSTNKSAQAGLPKGPFLGEYGNGGPQKPRGKAKKGAGSPCELESDDLFKSVSEKVQTGDYQSGHGIYLKQIGTYIPLTIEQEALSARPVRLGFEKLLAHMLESGFVMGVILERTEIELAKKQVSKERKVQLKAAMEVCSAALDEAKNTYKLAGILSAVCSAKLHALFVDLVGMLDLWPNIGAELLDILTGDFNETNLSGTSSAPVTAPHSLGSFALLNLMDSDTCKAFLAVARRMKAEVLAARNRMVNENLLLVVSEAKKLKNSFLAMEDLVQEGNLGLLLAVERFDERRNLKFSTFAVPIIKAAMRRENDNQGRTIRLPVHQCEAMRLLEGTHYKLENDLGRVPEPWELARESGIKEAVVIELSEWRRGLDSLHRRLGEEGDMTLEDSVGDPESLTPFYGKREISDVVSGHLWRLEDEERAVLCLLYGLDGCAVHSLAQTVSTLGLKVVIVKRHEQTALSTIRSAIAKGGLALETAA